MSRKIRSRIVACGVLILLVIVSYIAWARVDTYEVVAKIEASSQSEYEGVDKVVRHFAIENVCHEDGFSSRTWTEDFQEYFAWVWGDMGGIWIGYTQRYTNSDGDNLSSYDSVWVDIRKGADGSWKIVRVNVRP